MSIDSINSLNSINPSNHVIAVVDDEKNILYSLQLILKKAGFTCVLFEDNEVFLKALATQHFDLAILDIKLKNASGLEVYRQMQTQSFDMPVVFISGNATLSEAAQAVKMGAYDFIEKPFGEEKLLISIQRCLEHQLLKSKVAHLASTQNSQFLIGEDGAFKNLLEQIDRISNSLASVLIQGEHGTGKDLVAQMIHNSSSLADRPMIKVNCSAIPESLIEAELFGYERGAFTGAHQAKRGFFEQAHHGTLFLDEIGDMSLSAQAKVLRAIQNQEVQRIGSERTIHTKVRLICASNKVFKQEIAAGRFREDLYYRICVIPLTTLPLRERPSDISLLASHFLQKFCRDQGQANKTFSEPSMELMQKYSWPGNIRELKNITERLSIMAPQSVIRDVDLPEEICSHLVQTKVTSALEPLNFKVPLESGGEKPLINWQDFKNKSEREYMIRVLRAQDANISKTAEVLGLDRSYLHRKLAQLKIEKREYTEGRSDL